jgi:hypothetical protein
MRHSFTAACEDPSPVEFASPFLNSVNVAEHAFDCCPNQEPLFICCPGCGHVMVFCVECNTLFPDLRDPARAETPSLTREEDRLMCARCAEPFEGRFLMWPQRSKYLTTAEQVIAAGFGHLLAEKLRRERGIE